VTRDHGKALQRCQGAVLRNRLSLHRTKRNRMVLDRDQGAGVPFIWIPNLPNVLEQPRCCESVHCQNAS
jgi:hypothetical protein